MEEQKDGEKGVKKERKRERKRQTKKKDRPKGNEEENLDCNRMSLCLHCLALCKFNLIFIIFEPIRPAGLHVGLKQPYKT